MVVGHVVAWRTGILLLRTMLQKQCQVVDLRPRYHRLHCPTVDNAFEAHRHILLP